MATISFEMDLVIDTEEKAKALLEAIEEAENREEKNLVSEEEFARMIEDGEELITKGKI